MTDKPRVVVVGYGNAGRKFHCYLLRLVENLELHGVCSRNPDTRRRIEEEQRVRTYASLDDVCHDPNVDLVVLATPHDAHAPQALQAMNAGKHVVTDKVMCLSLADADGMIKTARSQGVVLSVFQNRRWDSDFLTVAKVWRDGMLGDVIHVETSWCQFGPPGGWRGKREHGGGKFLDLGAHLVDQAVSLVQEPIQNVSAHMHYHWPERDVESHADCLIRFANGLTWLVEASSIDRQPKPRWKVIGTKRTLVKQGLDPQEAAMHAGDIDAARNDPAHRAVLWGEWKGLKTETIIDAVPGRWRCFYENIADVLLGRAPLAVTPESVRRQIAVIDAAFKSSEQEGATVPLDV